ncbi:MAG: hypothetical protein ABIN91_21655 [Mucilaginibacter sp.]|uniref:hypothetical protein n=1 Tax=Mucilaginibacter sp. TaxID=1882438 RepID=UPI00326611AE
MKKLNLILVCILLCRCGSHETPTRVSANHIKSYSDSIAEFQRNIYLKIDKVHSGNVYTTKAKTDAFYRVLEVPEEESAMLIVENIAIGSEGGNYKLLKLARLDSAYPQLDSLKFADSINIRGYLNGKTVLINLDNLQNYHPAIR